MTSRPNDDAPTAFPPPERSDQRMHDTNDATTHLVDLVLDYSRRRILLEDVPLDKPMTPSDLDRLASPTITEGGIGPDRALGVWEHVLAPACISVDHPAYVAFIPTAPTKASIAFDLVVSASAIYGGSWIEGSGAVHAENEVLATLAREFGLPESAGGVFVQGGTLGNLSALVAARDHAARTRAQEGRSRPDRWAIACSAEAHSSVTMAARVMDIDIVDVPTDARGRLTADALRPILLEHRDDVFAVLTTAGSTNFGIVDDIAGIARLRDEFGFWLHVDGAYGLAAALVPSMRPLFSGVESADSLIVDPHKWLYAPLDACALLYRDPEIARRAHTQQAGYLEPLTRDDDWNPSDYAIHLSRRPRGLPTWFSMATHGLGAYRDAIAHTIRTAHEVADAIRERPWIELVREPQLSVVVFRRLGWAEADYDAWSARLLDDQRAFVTPSRHNGEPVTRFAVLNPRTTTAGLVAVLDTMA